MGGPKDVVARGVELGWGAVALTEHGWMGSAPALYQAAKAAKIKPILGCEMYVATDDAVGDESKDDARRHLTVLALSKEGYQNLIAWINESMTRPSYYNGPRISIDRMVEVAPHPLHHNVVMSGCMGGELCQAIVNLESGLDFVADTYIKTMREVFPNFYIELHDHSHSKFLDKGFDVYDSMIADQTVMREYLLRLAQRTGTPVIVANDSHYQSAAQRTSHIAMMARKDSKAKKDDRATSYAMRYQYQTCYMQSMERIAAKLPPWAEKQSLESIHAIVEEANIVLEPLDKETHSYTMPRCGYDDPLAELRKRAKARLKSLAAVHGDDVVYDRFEFELSALGEFASYIILYSDIVRMARSQGIYSWTRGSAANSLVCFCVGIHNIDPIHYKLLFERFVNPARKKLPDIDIDFEGYRRIDVVKMVFEHMIDIEGPDNVRIVSAESTTSNRNAFRLMAAAKGVPQERIDELAKLLPQMIDSGMATDEEEAYQLLKDEYPDLHELAESVFDAPSNITQHACALALGTEERPLSRWVPNHLIGSSNSLVTSYNMKYIEELGFMKLDLLRLDTLSIMHDIARMLGKDMVWLDDIMRDGPGSYGAEDDDVFTMLREGNTEGIHSMQGSTQRRGCMEVGVESDFDLIAVQALYRPSGTRTGNDERFVARKHGREEWESINPFVGKFLDETYGFAIYQEQIMEMGSAMGMSGIEVDDLYKAIKTAKGTGRGAEELFDAFEPTFRTYAKRIMSRADADELWAMWHQLQGYTFNRGHASSYALLAMKMAWLKCHHPKEFFTALLNRYPGNPRYVAGAIAEGFTFDPPDVNVGTGGFSRGESDNSIRVGLLKVDRVGKGTASEIVRNQPYTSVEDLDERTSNTAVNKTVIDNLKRIGAFECFGIKGDSDDLTDYKLLKFTLRKPRAFKGCKPQVKATGGGGTWQFLGLQRGVQMTEGKSFCAKLFWVLPLDMSETFVTKTSASGKYNAHLLTVVDENGLPMDLKVADDKAAESGLIKLLAEHGGGAVICAEGRVQMPFVRGGNTTFQFWGIAGAERENPQIWHVSSAMAKAVSRLAKQKENRRSK